MSEHTLKTTRRWFLRVAAQDKTAEIRKHDRDFQTGDRLILVAIWESDGRHKEVTDGVGETTWHTKGQETGDSVVREITHVLPAAQFPEGLQEGYCLLSMKPVQS